MTHDPESRSGTRNWRSVAACAGVLWLTACSRPASESGVQLEDVPDRPFVAAQWKSYAFGDQPLNARLEMVRALLRTVPIVGMARTDVIALLGPFSFDKFRENDHDQTCMHPGYLLGRTGRCGLYSRETTHFMVFDFDEHDRVRAATCALVTVGDASILTWSHSTEPR